MITPEEIDALFRQYGWEFERETDSHTWLTGFAIDGATFPFYAILEGEWLYLVVVPVIDPAFSHGFDLYQWLLRFSYELDMAKIGLDGDGDVALLVDLPTAGLDYDRFSLALDALVTYSESLQA